MNIDIYATINGVKFTNENDFSRVAFFLRSIKAPNNVIPTEKFIKYLQALVASQPGKPFGKISSKTWALLCYAFADDYTKVIDNMYRTLNWSENIFPVEFTTETAFDALDSLE
jgi:hypothetical protein